MGQQEVYKLLKEQNKWMDSKQISEKLNMNRKAIQINLKKMIPHDLKIIKIDGRRGQGIGFKYKIKN